MMLQGAYPITEDYRWQLDALNERLMDRRRYEAAGEDVDRVVCRLQRWLMEHEDHRRIVNKSRKEEGCMIVLPIRFYREKKGWSREELAEAVGVSEAEIKAYEGGLESPTVDKAESIANALGVTLRDLARGAVRK